MPAAKATLLRAATLAATLAAVVWSAAAAAAQGDVTSASELYVTYPAALKGDIEHRSALFGSANFGPHNQEIARISVLVEDTNSSNPKYPCPMELPASDSSKDEVILLMGWSQCRFVQEAIFAQDMVGAKGLIVVENRCLASNMDASTTSAAFVEHCRSLCDNGYCGGIDKLSYMGGVQHSVHIPSMIISRWDGLRMLECLELERGLAQGTLTKLNKHVTGVACTPQAPDDQKVLVNLKWNLPQESEVEYHIWMSSILNADIFTKQIWYENVVPLLVGKTKFTPHMFVYDGKALGCTSSGTASHCEDACHNSGRYCHYDPDGLGEGRISGADISRENLRQLCLWKILVDDAAESVRNDNEVKWWKYISKIAEECTGEDPEQMDPYSEACSKKVHESMGFSFDDTLSCVSQSGGYADENTGTNTILENELAKRSEFDIVRLPTIIVNGKFIEFESGLKDILVALCAGFIDSTAPDFCPCVERTDVGLYLDAALVETCLQYAPESAHSSDSDNAGGNNGVSMATLLFILVLVVSSLIAGFAVYRRRERARMRAEFHEDVRNIVGEYVRMDEGSSEGDFLGRRSTRVGAADETDVDVETAPRRANNNSGYQPVVELS
ncbi:Vacuolar-sorting receptor 1 [Hondaea fermentalgiana]|uniref:Vacuolar-sorting receptor 1 n=1 Tax=Hondaea fermentalgiana TaxID=2315210 RepID=A0A2R5G6N7_9STRA|nr:Vacuolar-sorting receptor 1 [Hondaea fermentalgiana]|eukprot:GBG26660.1 Vacuolar-sorting receptor 1 [Hondaea fermentalgiana]